MHSTAPAASEAYEFDLIQALQPGHWLKLPLAVMQDVGPAAQTFGGLLELTDKETFTFVESIAKKARVPLWTCRKHLVTLTKHGWITNAGRSRTRAGRPRRSCTLRINKRAKEASESYTILPDWSMCKPSRGGCLTWASKAVLSVVMSRLAGMIKTAEEQNGKAGICIEDA